MGKVFENEEGPTLVRVVLPDEREERQFNLSLDINTEDIHGEFEKIAAYQAFWNERFAFFEEQHATVDHELEKAKARAYLQIRARSIENGTKFTEDFLKHSVTLDDEVCHIRELAIMAEGAMKKARAKAEAFRTKRDALISYGALVRAEMGGDASLRNEMRTVRKNTSDY